MAEVGAEAIGRDTVGYVGDGLVAGEAWRGGGKGERGQNETHAHNVSLIETELRSRKTYGPARLATIVSTS